MIFVSLPRRYEMDSMEVRWIVKQKRDGCRLSCYRGGSRGQLSVVQNYKFISTRL